MTLEEFVGRFALLGMPLIVLIPMLVGLIKATGWVPDGLGGAVALIVSALAFGIAGLVEYFPATAGPVSYFVGALLVGLGAIGAHSTFKTVKKAAQGNNNGA